MISLWGFKLGCFFWYWDTICFRLLHLSSGVKAHPNPMRPPSATKQRISFQVCFKQLLYYNWFIAMSAYCISLCLSLTCIYIFYLAKALYENATSSLLINHSLSLRRIYFNTFFFWDLLKEDFAYSLYSYSMLHANKKFSNRDILYYIILLY